MLLRVMLERRGAKVTTASSSAEALQWFTEEVRIPTTRDSNAEHEVSTGSDSDRVQEVRTGSGSDRVTAAQEVSTGQEEVSIPTTRDSDRVRDPTTNVDIIISDLGLPEVDGYEFMRKIRLLSPSASQSSPGIPAIALTGYATSQDRERALSVGYQLHLAKPVEPKELVESILTLLRP